MTLGEKIQKLREEQNLTQKQLADKLEISTGKIAVWESNEETPQISDIVKLSRVLGVTTDSLIAEYELDLCEEKVPVIQESGASLQNDFLPKKLSLAKQKRNKKKLLAVISIFIIAFFVIIAFLYNSLYPFSKNTTALKKADESVVKIYCYDYAGNESATGSGFIAFNGYTVVTNYHVMENAYTCKISTSEDKTYNVNWILGYSKDLDIAILSLEEDPGLKALKLGNSDSIKKGESVTAIGSPLGIKNTISQGVLSGRIMGNNMDILQFSAPISSGSSGGALFDDKGKVIGVTYASYIDGQNLNLAIPINEVKDLYEARTDMYQVSTIYNEANPYVEYFENYTEEITVKELKSNPLKYKDKIVRIRAYVSSTINGDIRFISDFKKKSNDFDSDCELDVSTDFEKNSILAVRGSSKTEYEDKNLVVGDEVIIIGEFNYIKKGEAALYLGGREIINSHNIGEIDKIIVYKIKS